MAWPIIVVAVGLGFTAGGMFITFRTNPPNPEPPSIEEQGKRHAAFFRAFNRGLIKEPFLTKTDWSRVGFSFLKLGALLQFVGTVWQVVKLPCRG